MRNLGEPYHDATGQMRDMLVPGRYLFVYGVYYPEGQGYTYEAQFFDLRRAQAGRVRLRAARIGGSSRSPSWVNFYLKAQFDDGPVNYDNYRTTITLTGEEAA